MGNRLCFPGAFGRWSGLMPWAALCGGDEARWEGSRTPSDPLCVASRSYRKTNKASGCFLPHITLAILILACQTEKQFFCPYGRRRTRKMSLLVSRPPELSPPHSPVLQDRLETRTKTQRRDIHLSVFNLGLKFPSEQCRTAFRHAGPGRGWWGG